MAEVAYVDLAEAARECDRLLRHTDAHPQKFAERFLTAAAPGIIATIHLNAHYDSHERYVFALARERRQEYELIHARGLLLQLDCPDLAMERARLFQHEPLDRFLQIVETHVEAINRATASIPPDRIRLHVCWGNYDARTRTTSPWSRSSPCSTGPGWARCRSSWRTPGTSTSTG